MSVCTQCGSTLGDVRFCGSCGHPATRTDDWRTGTAERPAVLPTHTRPSSTVRSHRAAVVPPTPDATPRYPLYADEVAAPDATRVVPAVTASPAAGRTHRGRPAWIPWLVGTAVLLLVAGLGTWLLLAGDDETPAPTRAASDEAASTASEPTAQPTTAETPTEASGEPADVARYATAAAPATAPPNQDVDGNLVRYDARQMLDGVPETTWRMPGDGTGETLTFTLAEPTALSSVGLVNGYAKTASSGGSTLDWYLGNRRVLAVEWVFDDGTTIAQDLDETRDLQPVDVDDVTTETVQLRLVTVSEPGRGRASRNYTAISEVSLVGSPA